MYYLLLYQYTALWLLLCEWTMMLLTYLIVDFHLFYHGAVDIQIWALLTRSRCKVSDTQVTGKACGPLVKIWNRNCWIYVFIISWIQFKWKIHSHEVRFIFTKSTLCLIIIRRKLHPVDKNAIFLNHAITLEI